MTNKYVLNDPNSMAQYMRDKEKEIKDLEKENAELKTDKQYWEQKSNRLTTEWGKTLDQLVQAKEIIKQFLNDYPIITKELLDKLEQFLKEIEK